MKHSVFNALLMGTIAVGMAVSARASVSYNLTGSGFTSGIPTSIDSSDGLFELLYSTSGSSPNTVNPSPTSNVTYGTLTLECLTSCPGSSTFLPFVIVVDITDTTDGATGHFTGSSGGGTVSNSSSSIVINWSPLQLGFGNTNADTGSFGPTQFAISSFTGVVPPSFNSGVIPISGTVTEEVVTT